jgi:hypothetical protein
VDVFYPSFQRVIIILKLNAYTYYYFSFYWVIISCSFLNTGMVMMMRCSLVGPPPTVFKADHPFIYILAEKKDTQLFTGRLSKPNTA